MGQSSLSDSSDKSDLSDIMQYVEQSLENKAVFDFLSSGKTDGVYPEVFDEMAAVSGIHCMQDLQNFIAICRPGPLEFWNDYVNKAPCRLPEVAEIAVSTHNVLLYVEQIERALQLLI